MKNQVLEQTNTSVLDSSKMQTKQLSIITLHQSNLKALLYLDIFFFCYYPPYQLQAMYSSALHTCCLSKLQPENKKGESIKNVSSSLFMFYYTSNAQKKYSPVPLVQSARSSACVQRRPPASKQIFSAWAYVFSA